MQVCWVFQLPSVVQRVDFNRLADSATPSGGPLGSPVGARRLLPGLRGYTTTPLAEIIGNGTTDTMAMRSIKEFLQDR